MDSVTQFVLGASVGAACLGKRHGLRKAAIAGGLAGTLPDLDVFWDYGGPVENFVGHRSFSHSLFILTAISPILGEIAWRIFGKSEGERWRFWLATWLCLCTHPLLDSLTTYGTQLFWPLTTWPVAVSSIFIIDPVYTLPLLVVTLWALIRGRWTVAYGRAMTAALVLSTLYLGWSVGIQQIMTNRVQALLQARGIVADDVLVTPMPLSTLAWKAIAIAPGSYSNIYLPVFGDDSNAQVYTHQRMPQDIACTDLDDIPAHKTLAGFSKGFYRVELSEDGKLYQADLRMGMTPGYVFRYRLANRAGDDDWRAVPPGRVRGERTGEGDMDWLLASITGKNAPRPFEEALQADDATLLAGQARQSCLVTGFGS